MGSLAVQSLRIVVGQPLLAYSGLRMTKRTVQRWLPRVRLIALCALPAALLLLYVWTKGFQHPGPALAWFMLPGLVVSLGAAVASAVLVRTSGRVPEGVCPNCGYALADLRQCPECGGTC